MTRLQRFQNRIFVLMLTLLVCALIIPAAFSQTIGQIDQANVGTLYVGTSANATAVSAALPRNSFQQGSYTGTVTGYASPPTGTVQYRINGTTVHLFITTAITGTSNATGMTMTGQPAAVCPDIDAKDGATIVTDNGALVIARFSVAVEATSTCTITFGMGSGFSVTGFTNSGVKALQDTWHISYSLD